jgi:hypothetical protein
MVDNGIAQILQQARIRRARFFRRIDQFIQALDEGIIFGIAAAPFGIALLRPRAEAREQGQAENLYQDISHSDNRIGHNCQDANRAINLLYCRTTSDTILIWDNNQYQMGEIAHGLFARLGYR